jgi:hypothetical protein
MIRVLAAAVALLFSAAPALAQSPAPSPDPASLFAAERAAVGSAWDRIGEITERGTYDGGGASGPYVTYTDTHTGYSKSLVTIAGTVQASGYDAKGSWQAQDSLVEPVGDAATVASARSAAYAARNGWWNPGGDPATFAYAGRKSEGSNAYDVVRVVPQGGTPMDVWLDAATHLIARIVSTDSSNVTTTTTYGDYREIDGVHYPYSTVVGTGNPKADQHLHAAAVVFAASPVAADLRRPQNERTGTIAGATSTTIPFQLDNPYKGHIVVTVSVNGSRPLHVIFDTGGSNVVTPEIAREIGLKGAGSVAVGGAGEQETTAQIASGATLRIGAATLTKQQFGIFPLPRSLVKMTARYPVDGIVGYEILKNFVVSIDYVKRTLTLTDPAAFRYAGTGAAIAFTSATVPVIPATFDGVPGSFMFDTGNAFYNTISQGFLEAHALALPGKVLVQSSGNLGGAIRPRLVRVPEIGIGPYRVAHPVFAVTNTSKGSLAGTTFSGNIGQAVLSRFDVTLDYAHDVIYMKPNANFAKPFLGSLDGMSLYESDAGQILVSYVNPGSPAAKAGLAAGDRIVAVDGVPVAKLGPSDIQAGEAPGKTVTVAFERAGAARTCTLILREMVP